MNSLINEIIERANIVDVIGKYIKLKKSGANYFCLCPFHPDTNPSMSVSPKKKIYKCFSCGATGNVITFVQKFKKISFAQALKELAITLGYSQERINRYFYPNKQDKNSAKIVRFHALYAKANEIFKLLLHSEVNKKYLNYLLNERKLSLNTISRFEIGFCGHNDDQAFVHNLLVNKKDENFNDDDLLKLSLISINDKTQKITDYFHHRITFPIKDKNGFIIGFIGRTIEQKTPKYLLSKETILFSKSNNLFNFENVCANQPPTLIVVEGNIDLISLYEAGLDEKEYGVIALMGLAFTTEHMKLIKEAKFIKNILLWFDNDLAGKKTTITNGMKFLKENYNVFVVNNEKGIKDINEILVNFGKNEVLNCLNNQKNDDYISFYIKTICCEMKYLNTNTIIRDILSLLAKYGNSLFWSKYIDLIAQLTKVDRNDLKNTYQKIAKQKYVVKNEILLEKWDNQRKKEKFTEQYFSLLLSLKRSLKDLVKCVILSPEIAINVYEQLNHKEMKFNFLNQIICFIKKIGSIPNTPIEKIIADLIRNNNITMDFYDFISSQIDEINWLKKNKIVSLNHQKNQEKISKLVKKIDELCYRLRYEENKYKILNDNDIDKNKLQKNNEILFKQINNFKIKEKK